MGVRGSGGSGEWGVEVEWVGKSVATESRKAADQMRTETTANLVNNERAIIYY